MDCFSLGKVKMENKHLTSQSGHAIINGYFEATGTRRALIYRNNQQELNIELWEQNELVNVENLLNCTIHEAEAQAENWTTRTYHKIDK